MRENASFGFFPDVTVLCQCFFELSLPIFNTAMQDAFVRLCSSHSICLWNRFTACADFTITLQLLFV